MRELPRGTVTFLFTDVEGSTRLLKELGAEGYAAALDSHRRALREAVAVFGGVEVDTQGDAFFFAFPDAAAALAGAQAGRDSLDPGPIRVRMGLHTGTPHLTGEGYVGEDVHLGARVAAAGHGGQVLLSKATRELADGVTVLDLDEHRLKDFGAPVWIFQLGEERFPPLKTISNTNLPRPVGSFLGREREVAEVVALLRDGARLVTLTGPGGTGKTRLAIEAAAELVPEVANGVFWVGLAPLRDPALVTETIARALGARDGLAEHLGGRDLLLLLDNLEHMVNAAPELASLVEACPALRLLVTSRELLRVRGEVEYAVPPLAGPAAVELFCARSGLDANETIAQLCSRLDNLPLAVELAAARAGVLSPGQILDRLARRLDLLKGGRDADARQQTLRATIEWSHDLLATEEQALFARLAVFAGGCTLEAAEEVADADVDVLQALVDKSLVRRTGGRFWMLETIREYALERFEASGRAEQLSRRHAEHFTSLVEAGENEISFAVEPLLQDHENLRAALAWSCGGGDAELGLRLAGGLWRFWWTLGSAREPEAWYEAALSATSAPEALRTKALYGRANIAVLRGDSETAVALLEQCLRYYRGTGEQLWIARMLNDLGITYQAAGDFRRARPFFEQALSEARAGGLVGIAFAARANLAGTLIAEGLLDDAEQLLVGALSEMRSHDDRANAGTTLEWLALIELRRRRLDRAAERLRESLLAADQGQSHSVLLHTAAVAAGLAAARGDAAAAARLAAGCIAVCDESGLELEHLERVVRDEALAAAREQLGEAELRKIQAEAASSPEELLRQTRESLD